MKYKSVKAGKAEYENKFHLTLSTQRCEIKSHEATNDGLSL